MQNTDSSEWEGLGQVYEEDTLEELPQGWQGSMRQGSGGSLGIPQDPMQLGDILFTVTFRILEPRGVQCLQAERGHHPGEGGIWWPLLGDPPSRGVSHRQGKGQGWQLC